LASAAAVSQMPHQQVYFAWIMPPKLNNHLTDADDEIILQTRNISQKTLAKGVIHKGRLQNICQN